MPSKALRRNMGTETQTGGTVSNAQWAARGFAAAAMALIVGGSGVWLVDAPLLHATVIGGGCAIAWLAWVVRKDER